MISHQGGVKVENIVCSGSLNTSIDLLHLAEMCEYAVYGRNRYPAAYIKFDGHSVTVYRTGKYIMPGMRSLEDMETSFDKLLGILSPHIDISKAARPEIRNIVCSSNVGHDINLHDLYIRMISSNQDAVYEPESFPGLILKTSDSTFNVFQSGKFLILGCTDFNSVQKAESFFLDIIEEFESHRTSTSPLIARLPS